MAKAKKGKKNDAPMNNEELKAHYENFGKPGREEDLRFINTILNRSIATMDVKLEEMEQLEADLEGAEKEADEWHQKYHETLKERNDAMNENISLKNNIRTKEDALKAVADQNTALFTQRNEACKRAENAQLSAAIAWALCGLIAAIVLSVPFV